MKSIHKFIYILIILLMVFISLYIIFKIQKSETLEENLNSYNIPKMYLIGQIEDMQEKSDKRQIKVKYESDDTQFESYATIKVQGSYTLKFDKKNYNITFFKDNEFNEKQKFDVKWGEYSKYTLKANWSDPLHCRNIVTAQIASELNQRYGILTDSVNNGLTDGFPVEVYSNDEFWGLYTLNIHKDNLFNMDKENENHLAIFVDTLENNAFRDILEDDWAIYELEFGEENKENINKLNRLIDFVKNSTDEDFVNNFDEYFNKDSVLNYYCFMYFSHLIDNIAQNFFLVTYDGEIWYMVPYDFDQSWGNEFKDYSKITDYHNLHTSYYVKTSVLWNRFKELFRQEINDRYTELRKDILTKENVINKMNEFYKLIPEETLKKEQEKWNNKPDYERTYIEEYLDNELSILDNIYMNK
ncbi:MAG: CotH kinase family protein [Clostridia bacterium]|nr:CotH kinase family protein [Clostridia bacterium]